MKKLGLFSGIVAVLALAGCGNDDPVSSTTQERIISPAAKLILSANKAGGYLGTHRLIRLFEEQSRVLYEPDVDRWLTYFADDGVFDYVPLPAPMTTREEMKAFFDDLYRGFPDFHVISEHRLIAGNIIVTEHTTLGTHLGEWMGIPPTGKEGPPHFHIDVWEFEGNKIKKLTIYLDVAILLVNMGVMPPSELPPLEPSFELPDPEPTGLSPLAADAESVSRWNAHDIEAWSKNFHREVEAKYTTLGMVPLNRDQVTAVQELYQIAFPDALLEIVRRIDLGEGWVLTEAIAKGTNTGPYFGIPATGRFVEIRMAWLTQFDDSGLARYFRVYMDNVTMLTQLGLIE